MKSFFESKRFKVIVAMFAVIIGLMIAGVYNEGSSSFVSNAFGFITTPLQRVSSAISHSVSSWFQQFTDYDAVYNENLRLQEEVRAMREQLADYNTIKEENKQFNRIIDNIEQHRDWVVKPAKVIGRDSQSRFYSFTIDQGTLHGISYLDPVMAADGLVGYVHEVGANYAKVVTILDVKVDVGVYSSEERDIGVLGSTVELAQQGQCLMGYLPDDSKVKAGDMIFTSGSLSGGKSIYPKDIYVGKVVSVELDEHKTNTRAVVEPGAEVSKVRDVFVIVNFEGKGES